MGREHLIRMRWRLRGAWQWPVFGALTCGEAVLLNAAPVWGAGPGGFVGGLLLAASLNLVVVAVLAPLAGRLLRRRRPDLPRAIATDYAGTVLLVLLLAGFVAGGISHDPAVSHDEWARAAQAYAVANYVHAQEPSFRAGLERMDSMRLEPDMFRSCVPGPVRRRSLCLFVRTDQSPPGVTLDPNPAPNDTYRARSGF
jgi:hypothetical protein